MPPQILILRGFFKSYESGKIALLFLSDEQDDSKRTLLRFYSGLHNNPMKYEEFYVKYDTRSVFYADRGDAAITIIDELCGKYVELRAVVKNYTFTSRGKKISGWNLTLLKMNPYHYS